VGETTKTSPEIARSHGGSLIPSTHESPPSKRHVDRFSHFCTSHPCT